jgi:hypothetical protein
MVNTNGERLWQEMYSVCLEGLRKPTKNLSQDGRCLGKIRTERLPNANLERYRWASLLGEGKSSSVSSVTLKSPKRREASSS